ncbi:unnamed protein product [Lota lota]
MKIPMRIQTRSQPLQERQVLPLLDAVHLRRNPVVEDRDGTVCRCDSQEQDYTSCQGATGSWLTWELCVRLQQEPHRRLMLPLAGVSQVLDEVTAEMERALQADLVVTPAGGRYGVQETRRESCFYGNVQNPLSTTRLTSPRLPQLDPPGLGMLWPGSLPVNGPGAQHGLQQ